ncbi:hypothetical protein KY285_024860 [Solanum tuberosum]|nr:hypothetical protein KY284_024860 [Solanum tuberosum]KAH0677059.1 hypothetical protein KY285_024860 [Solanum tuberosum]
MLDDMQLKGVGLWDKEKVDNMVKEARLWDKEMVLDSQQVVGEKLPNMDMILQLETKDDVKIKKAKAARGHKKEKITENLTIQHTSLGKDKW